MNIEEIIKYSKNKIESHDLTKQVRRRIKETIWDKQNKREGFSETFKPLISQFEKPEDPNTKNIFTQNQEMLRNQLALTEGLRANQKAITDGFSQFERLADMKELPGVEAIEDEEDKAQAPIEKEDKDPIAKFNVEEFDRYLNNRESQDILESNGYDNLPSYYFDKDGSIIYSLIKDVNSKLRDFSDKLKYTAKSEHTEKGYIMAKPISQNPQLKTIINIKNYNTLSIYSANLNLFKYKEKSGSGIFYFTNPQELLKRFELLGGSLAAGKNGALPEYIQIAHRLRDLGVVTNNQLNKLLKNIYT